MTSKPKPKPVVAWERKPMARATRVPLFEREVRERLSGPAVDLLLARAQVLAEGRRAQSPTAEGAFFGSIMLTFDLRGLVGDVRDAIDDATAARLCALMQADARVLRRVRALAEREAGRLAGAPVRVHSADLRMRSDGPRVFVDIDVEAPAG
jgi:hypothetical protein